LWVIGSLVGRLRRAGPGHQSCVTHPPRSTPSASNTKSVLLQHADEKINFQAEKSSPEKNSGHRRNPAVLVRKSTLFPPAQTIARATNNSARESNVQVALASAAVPGAQPNKAVAIPPVGLPPVPLALWGRSLRKEPNPISETITSDGPAGPVDRPLEDKLPRPIKDVDGVRVYFHPPPIRQIDPEVAVPAAPTQLKRNGTPYGGG